ncbi:NAD(P)-dependent oxidoreductase [Elioraea tepidiphila]|uniref:NAD-dependent epimerase/dehydratase family protein n=1 Tax=Elioraea tepidiphila TaxID=457934 RepID=UPI00036D0415|nr:NAD(P)-dependent oxidoreductase [Elioraea tepidiphila]
MTVLVTGAAGFVGLATVEALLARGDTVVAFDRAALPEDARGAFARLPGTLIEVAGDVRSAEDLARAFAAAEIRRILHLAVITAGPAREKSDPETIVGVNVLGALAVFRAALAQGVTRLVSPSSVSVYGAPPPGCTAFGEDETWPRPAALYGITKLATEQMLARLAAVHGLSFAAARIGSVYGPWERETGVRDTLSAHRSAFLAAQRGEVALLNRPTRGDHVYVRDVAAGLIALLDAPSLDRAVFNLGSGVATDVAEFCRVLAHHVPGFRWRAAGPQETATVVTHVPFDRVAMDIRRIREATGFQPRFAGLDQAIADWLAAAPSQ